MGTDILLPSVCRIDNPEDYKMHVARWDRESEPLDVFVRSREEWNGWNRWKSDKDDFNRPFILALIDFYPQKDRWLFGGAYRVLARGGTRQSHSYQIELVEECRPLVGRLKLRMRSPGRSRAFLFEKHYAHLVVDEILPEVYSGEPFGGFDRIDLSFAELENIVSGQRPDWRRRCSSPRGSI